MRLLNGLLDKCIVEHERNCLKNAGLLLNEVDDLLEVLKLGGEEMGDTAHRPCRVCGFGTYLLAINREDRTAMNNFGLEPRGGQSFKVFICDNCGHVQLFSCPYDSDPVAWVNK